MSKTDRFDTFQIGDVIDWMDGGRGAVISKTGVTLRVKWRVSGVQNYDRDHVNGIWTDDHYTLDETTQVKRLLREYEGQS